LLHAPALAYAEPPAPISGGYDTQIFGFRLAGGRAEWAGPLILRVLSPAHDPARALRERATQNTLAGLGYPVPRVLAASVDRALLGAGFLVMERAAGRPLLDARRPGVAWTLAEMHARLHGLNPEPVLRALDDEGRAAGWGFDRDTVSFEGHLASLDRRIQTGGLDGLADGMRWLLGRAPDPSGPRVICHGDFHPQNVLVEHGRATGVLDWPNALVAEPAFDVASTFNILRFVPVGLTSMPAAVRWIVRVAQPLLARGYLAAYRRRRPIDDPRLAYYRVAAALRALVRAAETQRGLAGAPTGLDASAYAARLLAYARRVVEQTR